MSTPTSPDVLILGGGVCGLYAARRLAKAGLTSVIIEKEESPGGLAAARKRGGNFYDLGVHMLHEHDLEIYEDIMKIMGDESIPVELDAKISWAGAFFRYPLQFQDMIQGMPLATLTKCVANLFLTQTKELCVPTEPKNCEEALIQLYGHQLYAFFFKDFTSKYWGTHPKNISASFVKSKMPKLTAVDVVKKALSKVGIRDRNQNTVKSALSEETLHYSRTGADGLPRCLAQAVEDSGSQLILDASVTSLGAMPDTFTATYECRDGTSGTVSARNCISTIPLPLLPQLMVPAAPPEVLHSSRQLRYKPIAIYGLLVKKKRVLDALYIYYRSRVFHRIGEPKNAGLVVEPADHTVLIVETTCEIGDEKWNGSDAFFQKLVADLEAEKLCNLEDIVEWHLLQEPYGYPFYSLGFEEHRDRVEAFFETLPNLRSTGRQGGFCYPNMHAAMRMGADAADEIIEQNS